MLLDGTSTRRTDNQSILNQRRTVQAQTKTHDERIWNIIIKKTISSFDYGERNEFNRCVV